MTLWVTIRSGGVTGGFGFGFGTTRFAATSGIRRFAIRPSTEVATTCSTCLPGFARAAFQAKRKGGRRSTARRCPSTKKVIDAAFAPHGRTRSFTGPRTFVHGRAPALVSANVLLSTTIVLRAMS